MKAYKRQKIAMFALMATMGMTNITNTSFVSSLPSIYPSDIESKQVVPKMQKNSNFNSKQNTEVVSRKRKSNSKSSQNNTIQSV